MQIFVKLQGGRTRSLCFGREAIPVSLLKQYIEDFEGIPCHEQRLSCSQRELLDDTLLSGDDLLFVSLSMRVLGGKGGFGSLLRGAPSKIGQKKTDNFDACRDLSGRRMRHANNEKKLQEWIATAKEREMEQVALQHIKKIANQHKFDDEKYTNESSTIKESISHALDKGIDEAKKSSVLMGSKKRSLEEESASTGPFKKRQVWDDLDDIPDEESEPEAKEKKQKRSPTHPSTSTSPSTPPTTSTQPTTSSTTTTTTTTTTTSTTTSTPSVTHEESTTTTKTTTKITETTPAHASTPSTLSHTPATPSHTSATPEPTPIDLSKYATAKELEAIGGDALKIELQRLGLLCGGTPADRANRLFLLKDTPIEKLDKKHFAKKNKK